MKHAHTGFRNVLALVLLGAVAGVCFSLGMWQLGRASERDALHNAIERGRLQAPVTLSTNSRPADLVPWRPATAQGQWSIQDTVLLENRNLEGRPGYWVATPLLFDSASTSGAYDGVLVLRGWLPRDLSAQGAAPTVPFEEGHVEISGELHAHVPRIFELWSWAGGKSSELPANLPAPTANSSYPQVQNLEVGQLAAASGLKLLPAVLAQTQASVITTAAAGGGAAAAGTSALRREWPGPSLDSDQNRGYALQWFSFSTIAVVAALFVLYGMIRRGTRRSRQKETP